jgi:hypothetical protein
VRCTSAHPQHAPPCRVPLQAFDMGFAEYTGIMLAPTIVAGVVALAGLYLAFRSKLSDTPIALTTAMAPSDALRDRKGGRRVLCVCV